MPSELSYSDKVFQMLIDLNDGEEFNIKKNVREENKEKFYEIVQYFSESDFCKDFYIMIGETKLRKTKKSKWISLKDLHIREEIKTSMPKEKKESTIKLISIIKSQEEQGSLIKLASTIKPEEQGSLF